MECCQRPVATAFADVAHEKDEMNLFENTDRKSEEGLSVDREFYFQWHITQACNRRCAHCYHADYSANQDLGPEQLLTVADKIALALTCWEKEGAVSITGGEPFIRSADVFAAVDRLTRCEAVKRIDILTNGSLLDDDNCRRIGERPVIRRVQLSLEGATESNNDRIRGPGAFRQTLDAIRRLKRHRVTVSTMMTVSRSNLDQIESVLALLSNEGVDYFVFDRFIPEGQGEVLREHVLSKEEARDLYRAVYRWSKETSQPRVLVFRPLFCLFDSHDPNVGAMCSAGANALTVLHDGTLLPCRRLPLPLGNILADNLNDVWYASPVLWKLRNPSLMGGKCGACDCLPICRGCRAMSMATSGDWLAEDPQCWKE